MGKLISKKTGKVWDIPSDEMADALASGLYDVPEGSTAVITDDGTTSEVDASELGYHVERGAEGESVYDETSRLDDARIQREHGGLGGQALTVAEGALSSATLGGYDAVGGIVGGDDFKIRRRDEKQANPPADIVGEALGYLLPTGLAKGAGVGARILSKTPAAMAERLGAKIAATGANKGLLRSAGSKTLGYGLEGGAIGAGETLRDYSLAMTELEREQAAANFTSNVAFGAVTGGIAGAGSEVVARGFKKAKKLADAAADKMAARGKVGDDIAALDGAGIKQARLAEQARIGEELRDSAEVYHAKFAEVDPILIAKGTDEKILISERNKIRHAVGNKKGMAERPGRIKDSLQRQEQVLSDIAASKEKILKELADEDLAVLGELGNGPLKGIAAKKYGQFAGINVTKGTAKEGLEVTASQLDDFRAALSSGSISGARKKALDGVDELLAMNRAQQNGTDALVKGTAPKLSELSLAEDALKAGGGSKGFAADTAEKAVYGAVLGAGSTVMPFPVAAFLAGPISKKISNLVLGRLGKSVSKTAARTSEVASKFVDTGAKVLTRTPPLASKTLAAVRFADETPPLAASLPKATLVRDFKAREGEIYSQVTMGPNGLTMRPGARRALADRLSGVRVASPQLADSLETMANRKISFLASKLPKRPDFLAYKAGPDDWHPGNEAIRAFARYVAAAEDPAGVEDRLADGTITPQDVEAYKAIYPERYAALRNEISSKLPELQGTLSISKRMALSVFSDLPVEPSMNPALFDRLQAQFSEESGTDGGMQAPPPTPKFGAMGSISSQDKTRAQKRAE